MLSPFIPQWPKRGLPAIPMLFRALQPVDVYVEDTGRGDLPFYLELLNSAVKGELTITRVFPLGGRKNVVDAAETQDQKSRPALFIIDGDLPWVRGEPIPQIAGLHCHNAYCVENIVLCKDALAQLVAQDLVIERTKAVELLAYDELINYIQLPLIKLFSAYATVTKLLATPPKTVSKGVATFTPYDQKRNQHRLDQGLVEHERDQLLCKAKAMLSAAGAINSKQIDQTYQEILARVEGLPNPSLAISGKDFLFPLILEHLKSIGIKQLKRDSLRMRLVAMGDSERFKPLATALILAAKGKYA